MKVDGRSLELCASTSCPIVPTVDGVSNHLLKPHMWAHPNPPSSAQPSLPGSVHPNPPSNACTMHAGRAAHGLATLLADTGLADAFASELRGSDLVVGPGEEVPGGEVIEHLLQLAAEAERGSDVLTLQVVLSCIANYASVEPAHVLASTVPQLLAGVFIPADKAEALPETVLHDPALHPYALAALYNLRESAPMLMLLFGCLRSLKRIAGDPTASVGDAKHAREVLLAIQKLQASCLDASASPVVATHILTMVNRPLAVDYGLVSILIAGDAGASGAAGQPPFLIWQVLMEQQGSLRSSYGRC